MKVTQWPGKPDAMMAVVSKIRASLTRKKKNKGSELPYNIQFNYKQVLPS